MADALDAPLKDAVLLEEIELMTDLIVAAEGSDGCLRTREIDLVLGVDPTARSAR